MEGPVLVVITLAVCGVSYEVARRVALLRPLFGIRIAAVSTDPKGQPYAEGAKFSLKTKKNSIEI
jgi:hypothetical protein